MGGTDGDTTSHCGPGVHSILDVIKALKANIIFKHVAVAVVYGKDKTEKTVKKGLQLPRSRM